MFLKDFRMEGHIGIHALIVGELNIFKWFIGCRDTEGLHAKVAGELNGFQGF